VASLRARGAAVEYLRFEDEGHGLASLDNRVMAYPAIADFLDRSLARSG
jgi:dipeptidyl aminopeptidase/acylaminoacyl peptidase